MYKVTYTVLNQHTLKVNNWEQREKIFSTEREVGIFVKRISWNVAVTKINISILDK